MKKEKVPSVQEWLPIQKIFEKGIIKLKDNFYIKIIRITPINYNLKSDFEKESILKSYKTFLNTCNFDFQIIIQSNQKDLSYHINLIQKNLSYFHQKNVVNLFNSYIQLIKEKNQQENSSSKNFYIIIKNSNEFNQTTNEQNIFQELNEKYFKIKECLSRCGNIAFSIEEQDELLKLLKSFF